MNSKRHVLKNKKAIQSTTKFKSSKHYLTTPRCDGLPTSRGNPQKEKKVLFQPP